MHVQNRAAQRAWTGWATLALGILVSAALLWRTDLSAVLNTWYLTRAAGLVAYLLLFAATAVGLLQSLGMLKGVTAPIANLDIHQHLALWSLYASTFHAVILLFDHYVAFTWLDLLLPFHSTYQPVLLSLGILAFYLALMATVTSYLRSRMTPRLWRGLHLLTLVGFTFALVHGVAMGSDANHPVVAYLYRFTGLSVGLLGAYRFLKGVRTRHASSPGRG